MEYVYKCIAIKEKRRVLENIFANPYKKETVKLIFIEFLSNIKEQKKKKK